MVKPELPEGLFSPLDSWPPHRLQRWWARRLRRVLEVAYREMPFYRERFQRAGFHPQEFRSLEDLACLPILEKSEVLYAQEKGETFQVGMERWLVEPGTFLSLTSGTEGTTILPFPGRWRRLQGRSSLRAHWWAGLRPKGSFLLSAPAWHSYAAVQTWLASRLGLPTVMVWGTYLPQFAPRFLHALQTFRPPFLILFLPFLFSLLREIRLQGLRTREVFREVEVLLVTGAPMTPRFRDHLREQTGVDRVVELAGASENLLAVECWVGEGLHVVPDTSYVEVLEPGRWQPIQPGQRGVPVVTYTIPWGPLYIRYNTGDVALLYPSECPCGRPTPRIKLLGRWSHRFRLGRWELLPYDIRCALEEEAPELAGVSFAILQEGLQEGYLLLLLEGYGVGRGEKGAWLRRRLEDRFGVPVQVEWAEELPLRWKGVPPILTRAQVREG